MNLIEVIIRSEEIKGLRENLPCYDKPMLFGIPVVASDLLLPRTAGLMYQDYSGKKFLRIINLGE